METKKLKVFDCCCCSQPAYGYEQWHNRDTGYSICSRCAVQEQRSLSPEDMESYYGIEGVNYIVTKGLNND
jgi:hypothetical protein